jgi:SP family xylose:H+ symportor-like MFS transporter
MENSNNINPHMNPNGSGYLVRIVMVAALGGLLFGYDTAVIAGAIGFLRAKFILNAAQVGWAASSALVGCVIGCLCAGFISDYFGRKKSLIISAVLFFISAVGSAIAADLYQFVIFRMIGGIGVGMASMLSPLYIAEISPAHVRGRMVSYNQFAIVSGMLIVYFVNYYIAEQGTEIWNIQTGWRWMFASEALPAFLFFVFLFLVPESPRWLVKQSRNTMALDILKKTRGISNAHKEVKEIVQTIAREEKGLAQVFKPGIRKAMIIGVLLAILQQVTGINVFLYYAPEIFKKLGSGTQVALMQTIIIGAFNMGFTILAIKNVDKLGRKPLMMVGAAGMGACLFAMGFSAYFNQTTIWILGFILGYIASFALSVGPVTWVILSEIFPTNIRGRAMSVATVCLWTANWVVSQTFPMLDENPWLIALFNHGFTFWIYGIFCIVLILFVWRVVPETRGRTLEDIEMEWRSHSPRRNCNREKV